MATMTKRERVQAALRGEVLDRPPLAFWHHFRPRGSARALAEATIGFFGGFDLDIYKIMPDLPYPFPHGGIRKLDDWHLIAPIATDGGNFARQAEVVWRVRAAIGPDVPLISTLFSPLTEALYFSGAERFRLSIQEDPATVHGALATLTENLKRLGTDLLDAGADGIFLSVQGTGNETLTAAEFAEFGRPYDLALLSAWREGWLNILHAHGEHDLLIDEVLKYPVAAFSWSDRFTGIPLRRVWEAVPEAAVMGGLHERGAIVSGPAEDIASEMRDALAQTDGGKRLILAPGCSVPDDNPDEWLRAARQAVEHLS